MFRRRIKILFLVLALLLIPMHQAKAIDPVTIAILASFLTGMLMGLIYSFLTVSLRANQNVTGLVMTTFGVALSVRQAPTAENMESGWIKYSVHSKSVSFSQFANAS